MDTNFDVFDVLRIAEEIEHKAARFYLEAAKRFVDSQRRSVCYDQASWRIQHERAWGRLRRQNCAQTGQCGRFDPDDYVSSNPQVMAGLTGLGTDWDWNGRSFTHLTAEQLLRDARRRANGILIFYRGLKDFAGDAASRAMIDNMVAEEQRHILALSPGAPGDRMPTLGHTPALAWSLCAAV